ncbi:MAG TPA: hypothetical protein H9717_06235 [Candidatus Eisenbergiella merdipullorum]|uniref:DNA mismatch repair proteins mutS family domain-containing protein n=1 Tax=Candidatus Eisenbergiella merdipullorum TaxID=2838553 RepID=A0A9D2L0S7_9FIRM|nr:hypothetical protein [Candidatus Eisenbergiella merdipullorum]
MEVMLLLVCIALAAFFFFVRGMAEEKRKKKRQREKIHAAFGSEWDRVYKDEELSGIPGFYEAHRKDGQIDDITWDDLGMDEIYFQMNHTYSSAGQEYLYYALRTPALSGKEKDALEKMEEKISWFFAHEKEREDLQFLYFCLGRSGRYSIYDYLGYLDNLGERKSSGAVVMDVLLLLSVGLMTVIPPVGMMCFFIILIVNMFTYMKQKREVEPYLTSFAYVRRILDFARQIKKTDIPVCSEEWEELSLLEKKFGKFRNSAVLGMRGSTSAGDPASVLMDYVNMILHLDLICFNTMLREVRAHLADIDRMVELIGGTECCLAVASWRASLKNGWCSPVFPGRKAGGQGEAAAAGNPDASRCGMLEIDGLYHPLLAEPVKNSIRTERGVLITGSNASGKSTFLKAVAACALLAQTVHTCPAESYSGDLYRIFTSMALRDNLQGGESYYIVEIRALKRILDAVNEDPSPVLCFVDEVLRGTNTVERIAASTQVLKSLHRPGVLCFAATHDIELTQLLQGEYDNYHFEEQVEGDDIHFNYVLMPGRAATRNAIRLLGIIGYDEDIIRAADEMAADFLRTGEWK